MASGRSTTPSTGKKGAAGNKGPAGKGPGGNGPGGNGPGGNGPGGKRPSGGKGRGRSPVASARGRAPAVRQRQVPWLLIGAIAVIVVLIAVIGYFLFDRNATVSAFRPSDSNKDPSLQIPGIVTAQYKAQSHVLPTQRVAYDRSPPFGGPHDGYWAACTGVVYDTAVRNENMVHALEHGAIWIAYDPARISGAALDTLKSKVQGVDYTMLSPYPGLDQPISLQSWGHQLKLADANDPRIDQFITALKQNPNTYPEVGASCDALGPGEFDPSNPPPFDPPPYPADALPMTYQGNTAANGAMNGTGG